jgi:hypothetical protein
MELSHRRVRSGASLAPGAAMSTAFCDLARARGQWCCDRLRLADLHLGYIHPLHAGSPSRLLKRLRARIAVAFVD